MIPGTGKWSLWTLLFVGVLYVCTSVPFRYVGEDGNAWRSAINSDGVGYYAYLTGLFEEGDLAEADAPEHHFTRAGNNRVIQYYSGTPLLIAPFYLGAKFWTAIIGPDHHTATGMPYQIAVGMASLFYLILGLYSIRRLLIRSEMGDPVCAMTLLVIALGSGILYNAVITPSMSHVYGFAMVALVLAEAQRAWAGGSWGVVRTSIFLALAILVRPTLILIILALPLVAISDPRSLMQWTRSRNWKEWFIACAIGVVILFIQPLTWYLQCGLWWVDPYAGEGFNWTDPHLWSVLFGARKGFFFYWPLMLLATPGLALITYRWRWIGASLIFGLILIAYVTSAWWSWYYGYGYGMRALVDILPLLAIPIAITFNVLRKKIRYVLFACTIPLMSLQMFQAWQYQVGIIHPFNMDREKYGVVFLQSGDHYRDLFGWSNMAAPFAPNGMVQLAELHAYTGSDQDPTAVLDKGQLSKALVVTADQLPADGALRITLSCKRSALLQGTSNALRIVYTLRQNGNDRIYEAFPFNDIRIQDDRPWRTWHHAFNTPPAKQGEEFVVYLLQTGPGTVRLKDLSITVCAVR